MEDAQGLEKSGCHQKSVYFWILRKKDDITQWNSNIIDFDRVSLFFIASLYFLFSVVMHFDVFFL